MANQQMPEFKDIMVAAEGIVVSCGNVDLNKFGELVNDY